MAHQSDGNNIVINNLRTVTLVCDVHIDRAEVNLMSFRNKVVVFTLGAIAAVAGLSLAFTCLKHASILVASAVWGS